MSAAVHTDFDVAVKAAKLCETSVNGSTRQICEVQVHQRVKPQEGRRHIQCWGCGEFGHMQRYCQEVRPTYRNVPDYLGIGSWRSDFRTGKNNPRVDSNLKEIGA